jgi:hypothetical protein
MDAILFKFKSSNNLLLKNKTTIKCNDPLLKYNRQCKIIHRGLYKAICLEFVHCPVFIIKKRFGNLFYFHF